MKFTDAMYEMLSAYEMRYWMLYAVIIMIGYFTGLVNSFGLFSSMIAFGLGGWLAGIRMSNEGKT